MSANHNNYYKKPYNYGSTYNCNSCNCESTYNYNSCGCKPTKCCCQYLICPAGPTGPTGGVLRILQISMH